MPQRSGVVPGDTITVNGHQNIYGIAQDHGVSMREIIVLNNLQPPYVLKAGQSLVLPFKRGDVGSSAMGGLSAPSAEGVSAAPLGGVQQAPLSAIETQTLPPPVSAPIPLSPTPPPDKQSLKAPAGLSQVEALNAPSPPAPKPIATTMAAPPAAAAAAVATGATGVTSAAAPPAMVWPVQGPMLSTFGPKGQGVNNDGVNIGAPKGAPVVASASGIVVYAGNEMKGFGNLVLIRHEGGWVTAYAYLDRVLVAKDAVVAQGDMIGTVGKTGNVASPQLHFEVRHDGKVVDPSGIVKS